MKEPDKWDLKDFQSFLGCDEMGPDILEGEDCLIWGSVGQPNQRSTDLVVIRPRSPDLDLFSTWFCGTALRRFWASNCHRRRKPDEVHGMTGYESETLTRITYSITTVIAPLLIIASVSVLYVVKSTGSRLALSAVFNVIMSICVTTFTAANRAEVFAINAAYVIFA
jgi:hypothetical protein